MAKLLKFRSRLWILMSLGAGFALVAVLVIGAVYFLISISIVGAPVPTKPLPATPGRIDLRYGVQSVAISPDRSRIAVLHGNYAEAVTVYSQLQVFDAVTSKEIWHVNSVPYHGRVAFSNDGKILASVNDLYDAVTGSKLRSLDTLGTHISGVDFLPGGKTALGSGVDPAVVIYDLSSGRATRKPIDPQPDTPYDHHRVAVSPDGRLVATCGEHGKIYLRDVASWAPVSNFTIAVDRPFEVQFSADGKWLLCQGEGPPTASSRATQIFDVTTGKTIFKSTDWISSPIVAGDKLFSQNANKVVIYDVASGAILGTLPTSQDMDMGLELSRDQVVLAVAGRTPYSSGGSGFSDVKLWDLRSVMPSLSPAKP